MEKLPLTLEEKLAVKNHCIIKIQEQPPAQRTVIHDACATTLQDPASIDQCLAHKTLNPDSPWQVADLAKAPDTVAECEGESLKAPNAHLEQDFRRECYGTLPDALPPNRKPPMDQGTLRNKKARRIPDPEQMVRELVLDDLGVVQTQGKNAMGATQEKPPVLFLPPDSSIPHDEHLQVPDADKLQKKFHLSTGPFRCDWVLEDGSVCGYSTTIQSNLTKHINAVHRKLRSYICTELNDDGTPCGQSFTQKSHLTTHIDAVHRKQKPFVCNELLDDGTPCGKAFAEKGNLEQHIDAVHCKQKPFVCPELNDDGTHCEQSFALKQQLERHIDRVHRKLKPYVCNELKDDGMVCGQARATKDELKRHIEEVHLKLKRFPCTELLEDGTVCPRGFTRKILLERHIEIIHRKKNLFVCHELKEDGTVCGQSFTMKPTLTHHINEVHRKLKPYVCTELKDDGTVCGQPCARKTALERHIKKQHRKFKVYCSKCGKPYKRKDLRDANEEACTGLDYEKIKRSYHVVKGSKVEDVVINIIEQYCEESDIPTERQKVLSDPALGERIADLYCEGLEGNRVAVDVTNTDYKGNLVKKWAERRYQDYPEVDELWVIVCSNAWDNKRCVDLTNEVQRDPRYENVYIYHWTDLLGIKGMTIPPKIRKLLEIYEKCTLENREECKKHWEEAKAQFHAPDFLSLSFHY